ncbi:MAG: deoxyribodipyrimidine photo-lyase [Oligoflexales bacterium]|nr:deoxyribodipyrimidine photo-lyase [Oligoflexales bacterium]
MIVVWFKKDLRVYDHKPLSLASQLGPAQFIYVYEQELLNEASYSPAKHSFLNDSLAELDQNLRKLGASLTTFRGTLPGVFAQIHSRTPITLLLSHEETGNHLSYRRDIRVKEWCREAGVKWQEFPQTGVIRALKNRDGWARSWNKRMNEAIIPAPNSLNLAGDNTRKDPTLYTPSELGVKGLVQDKIQKGGESQAHALLQSFLTERGKGYSSEMSSPITAENSRSRLSTYLAYGNISIKSVFQATQQRQEEIKSINPKPKYWGRSLSAFSGRLRWHYHFMQKLEDEPSLEHFNLNRGFDELRSEFDEEKFEAWKLGETGYPIIDACMKYLRQTGWINFRMRAMLVSFSSYHLWLPWQRPAEYLAELFLD